MKISLLCSLAIGFGAPPLPAEVSEPEAELLWPAGAPGSAELPNEEREENRKHQQNEFGLNRSLSRVTVPAIWIYPADGGKNTGAAVVICPGGGYGRVVIDKEGHDIARRLSASGVTGVVLKYRNPRPDLTKGKEPWPIQDVKRAIQLIRSRSEELGVKRDRIGVMGFSAGGHLASAASVHYGPGEAGAEDPVSGISSRPDFTALIYPVVTLTEGVGHGGSRVALLGKGATATEIERYSSERQVGEGTPPAFLAHAKDDAVKAENSVLYAEALRAHGIACELHLFEKGGHGFGLGLGGGEPAAWPELFIKWLGKRNAAR